MGVALIDGGRPASPSLARRLGQSPDLDLLIVAASAVAALVLVLVEAPMPVRLPLGLVAALLLPGYAVGMAVFPPGELDAIERAALSFSLSLVTIVIGAPLLDFAADLTNVPIAAATTAVTLSGTVLAAIRRRRRPAAHGPLRLPELPAALRALSPVRRAALAVIASALIVVAYVGINATGPSHPATEFALLGAAGTANGLPARVTAGSPFEVTIRITNEDDPGIAWRVVAESGNAEIARLGPVMIASGDTWSSPLELTLGQPGPGQEVDILLFRNEEAEPFRTLRLEVDAEAPA